MNRKKKPEIEPATPFEAEKAALSAIIKALAPLDMNDRQRVIKAAQIFFGDGGLT